MNLNGFPSFMNIDITPDFGFYVSYTRREIEIIKCVSERNTNKTIAEKLQITIGTVTKHRHNIIIKSGCKNSAELINKSLSQGLI